MIWDLMSCCKSAVLPALCWAVFFLGMSDCAEGKELDVEAVKRMFAGGLYGVKKQTKAQRGDKTMMDALIPAVEAMQAVETDDVKAVMEAGAQAALKGAESNQRYEGEFRPCP